MDRLYKLVKTGQILLKIKSDRAYALAIDIKPQVIVDLKASRCIPNAENMLKMLEAANMNVREGIQVIQDCKKDKSFLGII